MQKICVFNFIQQTCVTPRNAADQYCLQWNESMTLLVIPCICSIAECFNTNPNFGNYIFIFWKMVHHFRYLENSYEQKLLFFIIFKSFSFLMKIRKEGMIMEMHFKILTLYIIKLFIIINSIGINSVLLTNTK